MHFTLRPETPQEKRVKDGYRAKAKAARAARRLAKRINPKRVAIGQKPDDPRGFREFWRTIDQRLLGGLTDDELQKVRDAAWRHHHATTYSRGWTKVLIALEERLRAAALPEPADYWKRGITYVSECAARREGW